MSNPLSQLSQLKDLRSAREQIQQRDQHRQGAAQTLYAQAQELLAAYNRDHDKQTLRQCMLALTEAIRAARSYDEPYLLLGFIYLSLGLPQLALKYVRVADHLQSRHPLLPKLKAAIAEGYQAPVVATGGKAKGDFSLIDFDQIDYDALYDEVDAQIGREIEAVMNLPIPVRPKASSSLIAQLAEFRTGLEGTLEVLSGQLEIVEQEIDCARQRSKLRLIETRWRQLLAMEEHCRQFLALRKSIQRVQEEVWIELADPHEDRLETYLDQCDGFADELDALSSKGLDISELEAEYNTLTDSITQLQERLDS